MKSYKHIFYLAPWKQAFDFNKNDAYCTLNSCCPIADEFFIDQHFKWSKTKQGYYYWHDVDRFWTTLCYKEIYHYFVCRHIF